jgi:hypothetical protein
MRNQRRFQTFRPGKAQKFLRWAGLNFLSLLMITPYRYEHPSAKVALVAVLGFSLAVLLTLALKYHLYESRRAFDS